MRMRIMNYQEINELYLKLFIEILQEETKPNGFSKTVYLTMLAIQILEKIGTNQKERTSKTMGIITSFNIRTFSSSIRIYSLNI